MATKTTLFDLFQTTNNAISDNIYSLLHIYDRSMFATTCNLCLAAFIRYLENIPKDQQLSQKSFALRTFILRPIPDETEFYPLLYLNELKKVGAVLYPASSPEFVGKLRKALYQEDILSLKVLIDFGVDASKIMVDILRRNYFPQDHILKIVFSSKKINVNYNHFRGRYPLLLAAIWTNKFGLWQVLKENNVADWNYNDKQGRNLAYWATCCRTSNAMKFLRICHEKNVNMDHKDHNGNRAATIAVCHKKLNLLKYLVEECKVDINEQNSTGCTIAHDACERAYPEILTYLLTKGLRVDIKNNNNETAIDHARMYYSQDIIDVLIANNLWNE